MFDMTEKQKATEKKSKRAQSFTKFSKKKLKLNINCVTIPYLKIKAMFALSMTLQHRPNPVC